MKNEVTKAPLEGEILGPEALSSDGLTPAEEHLHGEMNDLLGRAVNLAIRSRVPVHAYNFSFSARGAQKTGVLVMQTAKQGTLDVNQVAYELVLDESAGKITITHGPTDNAVEGFGITGELDGNGLMSDETFEALVTDFAGRIGVDPVALWALVRDDQIFDPEQGQDLPFWTPEF